MKYIQEITTGIIALAALMSSVAAQAGDPCSISFSITDIGPQTWAKDKASATSHSETYQDPFFESLITFANELTCTQVKRSIVRNNRLTLIPGYGPRELPTEQLQLSYLHKKLFTRQRRFRCAEAAMKLSYLKNRTNTDGVVLFLRGKRRVLLVLAGWDSFCIPIKEISGERLTKQNVLRMWTELTQGLVKYRHENP